MPELLLKHVPFADVCYAPSAWCRRTCNSGKMISNSARRHHNRILQSYLRLSFTLDRFSTTFYWL